LAYFPTAACPDVVHLLIKRLLHELCCFEKGNVTWIATYIQGHISTSKFDFYLKKEIYETTAVCRKEREGIQQLLHPL